MSDKTYNSSAEYLADIEDTRNWTLRSTRKVLGDFHRRNLKGKQRLLEIGTGIGFLRRAWPHFNGEWAEFEIFSEHLKESKRRNPYGSFIRGDGNNLPFRDEVFDVVCGFNSFDQYPGLDHIVSESYRVLKPGGLFFHMMDQPQATLPIEEDLREQGFATVDVEQNLGRVDHRLSFGVSRSLCYGTPEEVVEYLNTVQKLHRELKAKGEITPETLLEIHEMIKGKLQEIDTVEALTGLLIKSLGKYFLPESVESGYLTAVYKGRMTDRQISMSERGQKFVFEGYSPSPNLQDEYISETDMFLPGIVNNILGKLPSVFTKYIRPRVLEISGINYVKAIKQ